MSTIRHICASFLFVLATLPLFGQQPVIFRQINTADSLARALAWVDKEFTKAEHKCHTLIWSLREIREGALALKQKGAFAFTMTDEWPSPESEFYVISFYEIILRDKMMDRYNRLHTYRINKKMRVEQYNPDDDSWLAQQ